MTSLPYPTFRNDPPVDVEGNRANLSAVGRCQISPHSSSSYSSTLGREDVEEDLYRKIVARNQQQACVALDDNESVSASVSVSTNLTTNTPSSSSRVHHQQEKKQLKKKYMKEGVALAKKYLIEKLQLDVSIIDVQVVVLAQDVISTDGCLCACLLDAGAQTIVLDGYDLEALHAAKIPRERMMGLFVYPKQQEQEQESQHEQIVHAIRKTQDYCSSSCIQLNDPAHVTEDYVMELLDRLDEELDNEYMHIVLQFDPNHAAQKHQQESLVDLVAKICNRKNSTATVSLIDPTSTQLGTCFAGCMRTDRPDGLYTTVVCTRSGEALGLVYSSDTSIVAALESGRGVYYSRSRQGLWRKGDTSGHYQVLHRLDVDCDGDALRFTVTQMGDTPAFCHLETFTCWGNPRGVRHLEEVLQERLISAPEGSYTKRLFDDSDLLRNKLVEEAQELSEAKDKQHVAEELADVLYFAMVQAVKAGVSLDDAVAELDKRARKVTRRQGDSKAFRIAAGKEILDRSKDDMKNQE